MSYIRVWVHAIFSTKNREQNLSPEIRKRLFEHIKENCRAKGIFLDCAGGGQITCTS
ncbi:MAG: hypothetical protein ACK4S4_14890 [Pyrinomonadaceae bacterium]